MLHPLLIRHPHKGLRTALLFGSRHPSIDRIPELVPPSDREPIPGGWVVADLWVPSLVAVFAQDVCQGCGLGQPCAFGRKQEPLLAVMGYRAPWGDDLAAMAERVPVYGGTVAMGIRAFSRIDRMVGAAASFAAKLFPAPGSRNRGLPTAAPRGLAPDLEVHARTLGLTWPFTLADVHREFLRRAPPAHPDRGGTAERIRAVVDARNAFVRAWGPKRNGA